MKFAFRTDASSAIGNGHVVRCAALADELKDRGAHTVFFCREAPGHLCGWLEEKGHEVRRLLGQASSPLEIGQMHAAVAGEHYDWLVVDHYDIDIAWEQAMATAVGARFVIDDIRREHDCELLLDQNILDDDNAYREQLPEDCIRLLGPRYALLRPEFSAMREKIQRSCNQVAQVLIGFGGADPGGETAKAIEGFLAGATETIRATVLLGKSNPNRDALMQRYGNSGRLHLLDHCDDMPSLMAACDLAVGAGGISTWERACLGLPSIVTAIAENQRPIAEAIARRGGQIYLGTHPATGDYADALRLLAANSWLRESCAETASRFADGRGCKRVAAALWPALIDLRPARIDDAEDLLAWRNADVNRLPSFDPTPILMDHHLAWLKDTLNNPTRALLIGEEQGRAMGVLRYDFSETEADVSIYLVPGFHGRGWGAELLRAGTRWLRKNRPDIARIKARIKADNDRSQSAFRLAGYASEAIEFTLKLAMSQES